MDERTSKAFDFAKESVKQLITLATGIIAVWVGFIQHLGLRADRCAQTVALVSWIVFLLSILCGLWGMLALTGTLGAGDSVPVTIRGKNVTRPVALQVILFVLGLALVVAFGVVTTYSGS